MRTEKELNLCGWASGSLQAEGMTTAKALRRERTEHMEGKAQHDQMCRSAQAASPGVRSQRAPSTHCGMCYGGGSGERASRNRPRLDGEM